MGTIVCPIDSKDDTIQKISSIVSSGKSTGSYSGPSGGGVYVGGKWGGYGGYSAMSGNTITDLAQQLTLPSEPKVPKGCSTLLWIFVGGFLTWFVAEGIGALAMYALAIPFKNPRFYTIAITISLIAWPFIIALSVFMVRMYVASKMPEYYVKKAAYDNAVKKWNRLYYCWKHDIVFDPETGESYPPTETKKLYRQRLTFEYDTEVSEKGKWGKGTQLTFIFICVVLFIIALLVQVPKGG